MSKARIWTLAVLTAAVPLVAGCGGDGTGGESGGHYGGKGPETTETTAPAGAESGAAVVTATMIGDLGKVIVDSEGFTLYDFHKDRGTTSSCYGACAQAWPPLLTAGDPQAGEGAVAAKLGTTERKDGTTQVTYAGHPLYTFSEDTKPGEARGNDVEAFGAEWYALEPSGSEPED